MSELKAFVQLCKENPSILHLPEMGFFKTWLQGSVTYTSELCVCVCVLFIVLYSELNSNVMFFMIIMIKYEIHCVIM